METIMSDTALLVIDAQESFRHLDNWQADLAPAYFERQQRLINGAKAAGLPILQIFHLSETGPFSEASGLVETLAELTIAPDAIFKKRRHSALVASGLDVWLTEHGIGRLIVSGLRTEQCCETTTRHASDLGYTVDYVGEATFTSPITDAHGHTWSVSDLRARTEAVLAGRFARIATVEEALDAVQESVAA